MHFTKLILAAILSYSTTILADPLNSKSAIAAPQEQSSLSTSLADSLEARQVGKGRKFRKRKGLKGKAAKAKKARRLVKREDEEGDEVAASREFDFLDEDGPVTTAFDVLDEGDADAVEQPALERRQGRKGRKRGRKNRKAAKGAAKGAVKGAAKGKAKARRVV